MTHHEQAVATACAAPRETAAAAPAPTAADSLAPHWVSARQARELRLADAARQARTEAQVKEETERVRFAYD